MKLIHVPVVGIIVCACGLAIPPHGGVLDVLLLMLLFGNAALLFYELRR